jgi:hypothetical protein
MSILRTEKEKRRESESKYEGTRTNGISPCFATIVKTSTYLEELGYRRESSNCRRERGPSRQWGRPCHRNSIRRTPNRRSLCVVHSRNLDQEFRIRNRRMACCCRFGEDQTRPHCTKWKDMSTQRELTTKQRVSGRGDEQ